MVNKVYFIVNLVIIILIIDSNGGQTINNGTKIVGGAIAQPNQIPYQVSIRIANRDYPFGAGHRCGGILISNKTILTAAHCVYEESATGVMYLLKPNQLKVVMGTNYRFNQTIAHLSYLIKSIHPHYNYSGSVTVMNDIATLIIDGVVPENHVSVRPITLASLQMPINTPCIVSGFGTLSSNGPISSQLMYAQIYILNRTQCNINYQNKIKEGMICAGLWAGGIDSCQGDSGGPLVCNDVLSGIVSWGNLCALENFPGVYTDVFHYRNWIAENNCNLLVTNLFLIFLNLIFIYI